MVKDKKDKKEKKEEVKKIKITIDGQEFDSEHRVFASGREGYGLYGRIKIDGYPHRISLNLIEM